MKMTSVIGCVSCGKPALLVGDEAPKAFPACFWCLAERRPGASELFLDEVRAAERERVLVALRSAFADWDDTTFAAVERFIVRIRAGEP